MPFTASHPAAVLALARWGLPGSALVVGSIAPDMPMVLPIPVVTHFAHTPLGVVTADLAIGVVGFVLWQALFGPALIAVAPKALRARLPDRVPAGLRFHFGQWNRSALVVAALLIGAVTHVVWDNFTHDWMWGSAHIPWLASRHGPLMGWEWAQRISDVAGLAIVAGWVVAWWRAAPERPDTTVMALPYRMLAWLAILCPAVIGFFYWLLNGSVFFAVTRGGGLGVIGLTAMAVTWWVRADRTGVP
jgi:Domain of unknown function (DUF4184)